MNDKNTKFNYKKKSRIGARSLYSRINIVKVYFLFQFYDDDY